jgi:hypothetical protein
VTIRMDFRIVTVRIAMRNLYVSKEFRSGLLVPVHRPGTRRATEVDCVLNNRQGFGDGTHPGPIPAKGMTFPLTLLGRADEVIDFGPPLPTCALHKVGQLARVLRTCRSYYRHIRS